MRIDRVKLIAEMARKDLTTLDLAESSRGTITGIRSGKSCSKASADKLAKGLGVPVADIIEKGA